MGALVGDAADGLAAHPAGALHRDLGVGEEGEGEGEECRADLEGSAQGGLECVGGRGGIGGAGGGSLGEVLHAAPPCPKASSTDGPDHPDSGIRGS